MKTRKQGTWSSHWKNYNFYHGTCLNLFRKKRLDSEKNLKPKNLLEYRLLDETICDITFTELRR